MKESQGQIEYIRAALIEAEKSDGKWVLVTPENRDQIISEIKAEALKGLKDRKLKPKPPSPS